MTDLKKKKIQALHILVDKTNLCHMNIKTKMLNEQCNLPICT